jgi:hypothetical protein
VKKVSAARRTIERFQPFKLFKSFKQALLWSEAGQRNQADERFWPAC